MAAPRRRGRYGRGPGWGIDEVLARTDLAELLDQLAEPAANTTRGRRWHCPVPGHQDRHPSVSMHTDAHGHERWRCWSGDETHRGDAVDLVMVTQEVTRPEAIELLAGWAGMVPGRPLPPPRPRTPAPARPAIPHLSGSVLRYVRACERVLWQPDGEIVRTWLARRGLHEDVLRANRVGADPGRGKLWRDKGLPAGRGLAATFPALDQAGRVRYVQARYLHPRGGIKYDNPATRLGTNPRLAWTVPVQGRTPYPAHAQRTLVVCEGIPDALTAAQEGLRAVAVLGSQAPDASVAARIALAAEQHGLAIVAVTDVDPDGAGERWGRRLDELLAEHGHRPVILEPAVGNDLNDWARRDVSWSAQVVAAPLAVGRSARTHLRPDHDATLTPPNLGLD